MTSPVDYIARGWRIFPCHSIERGRCTCKKDDCHDPGKHPRTQHGLKDASSDPIMISAWMDQWPNVNWALLTGPETGFTVIDIDPRHSGYQSFEQLQQQRGRMPDTLRSATGGGGRHLFYQHPLGFVIPGVRGWMPGIDIKSNGGYVILPESQHKSGLSYRWINLDLMPATELPADIAKMILDRSSVSGNGGGASGDLGDTETILQGVPEGERDDTLFRWACRLRRQMGDGSRRIVELAVLDAAARCSPPFPADQALRKVEQAWAQDHSDSFVDWQIGTETEEEEAGTELGQPRAIHPLTDLGNAYRFYDAFGKDMLYVRGWGWLVWTEIGWQLDAQGTASALSHQLSNLIMNEARTLEKQGSDIKAVTQHLKWAFRSQSAATMSNSLLVAQDIPMLRRSVDQFDANDDEICCRDQMVNLRTGESRPVTKDDLVLKNTNVEYDPDFQLTEWNRFLWDTCGGDLELIMYLQRVAGYIITGRNTEEKLFLVSGPPASGKSTFLDALGYMLGGYETTTSPDTFMWSRIAHPSWSWLGWWACV
jgi:hypothetical protein